MGEYFFATIDIPVMYFNEALEKAIEEEGGLRKEEPGVDGILRLEAEQATNGEFENLESFLVENNIPFDRYSSAYYEFSPCNRYFRPERTNKPAFDEVIYSNPY